MKYENPNIINSQENIINLRISKEKGGQIWLGPRRKSRLEAEKDAGEILKTTPMPEQPVRQWIPYLEYNDGDQEWRGVCAPPSIIREPNWIFLRKRE